MEPEVVGSTPTFPILRAAGYNEMPEAQVADIPSYAPSRQALGVLSGKRFSANLYATPIS